MPARSPEEIHARFAAAFNAGDLDAFVALHEEDATSLIPPDGRAAHGKAAIRAALEPLFALRPRARIDVAGKVQSDGLALTHARWRLVGTDPAGDRVELGGRGTVVSRRQPDGSWLVVLDNPVSPK